jgi:glycolate oxidase FAD binding subunit
MMELDELAGAVAASPRLLPVAGATKPALSEAAADVTALDVSGLRGMLEYDPAELTFTARAGTPLREIAAALAEHDQYLPFDPPLVDAGATLGGTVAAGVAGPGAYRYGGVRDFVLGVQFVDGTGTLRRAGGRVVKNAAGFDLPKLLVGSMGRLGVITELALKVLPAAEATATVAFTPASLGEALEAIARVGRGPVEADAVDLHTDGRLLVRLAGRVGPLPARVDRLRGVVGVPSQPVDEDVWVTARELTWAPPDTALVRVGLTPAAVPALAAALGDVRWWLSIGANVAWIATDALADLNGALATAGLTGMRLRGGDGPLLLGAPQGGAFADRVRAALDPEGRFSCTT